METWMWISLYIVQTLAGAVFYRKYFNEKGKVGESVEASLIMSAVVIINCIVLICLLFYGIELLLKQLFLLIDYLAGVKNKDTLKEIQKAYEKHLKEEKKQLKTMKTYIITEEDIERLYALFPDLGEGLQACTIINNWEETLEYVSDVKLPYSGIKTDGK